jgi:hypothetical protein
VVNFEIDVEDGITETNGGEAVLIAGQSNMLSKGTIGARQTVPAGETAIRITNGRRQVIRDVDFVGTFGSSAPLISVNCSGFVPLTDSIIVAKCHDAGTFLDLHPAYTIGKVRGSSSTTIQLAASQVFLDNELNGMIVLITSGTGTGQFRSITDYSRSTNTATVTPPWATSPGLDSGYEIRSNIGTGNYIRLTTNGFVTKPINLPPNWNDMANEIWVDGVKQMSPTLELTISNGVIALSQRNHVVDTESDAATDDLTTINGGIAGRAVILRASHNDRTVVLKTGVGNLKLEGDFPLNNTEDTIMLSYDGTVWLENSRSDNGN